MFRKNLEVVSMPPNQVRGGYVKIEAETRRPIKSGTLILISCGNKTVFRLVIGEGAEKDKIVMDEPTRDELEVNIGSKAEFRWRAARGIFEEAEFYWRHPDFSINFASRIAIISLILSTISLALPAAVFLYEKVNAR